MKEEYFQEFQGVPNSLTKARDSMSNYLKSNSKLSSSQIVDVEIAFGEVIQNIVRYGYKGGQAEKTYKIWITNKQNLLKVLIKDSATPIQDLSFLTDRHLPSELGKMGISLINKIASNYTIIPQSDGNLHTLEFSSL